MSNIVNPGSVDHFVRNVALSRSRHEAVSDWCRKNLRNFLMREGDRKWLFPINSTESYSFYRKQFNGPRRQRNPAPAKPPEWAKKLLKEGKFVDFFHMEMWFDRDPDARDWWRNVDQAIDWLNILPPTKMARIDRISVPQAIEAGQRWHEQLARQMDDENLVVDEDSDDIKPVMMLDSGYRAVLLVSEAAYVREGHLMGHCVGSGGYIDGKSKIYSLRDRRNRPHCTIEVRNDNVAQIKGKQNRPPVEKYWPMVRSLLLEQGWSIDGHMGIHDAEAVGIIRLNGRLYWSLDEFLDNFDPQDGGHPLGARGTRIDRAYPASHPRVDLAFTDNVLTRTILKAVDGWVRHTPMTPERSEKLYRMFEPSQAINGEVKELMRIGNKAILRMEVEFPVVLLRLQKKFGETMGALLRETLRRSVAQLGQQIAKELDTVFVISQPGLLKQILDLTGQTESFRALTVAVNKAKIDRWNRLVSEAKTATLRGRPTVTPDVLINFRQVFLSHYNTKFATGEMI